MAISFDEYDRYSIAGKITNIDNNGTLTISVTSPFVREIQFYCSSDHYDMLHPPASPEYDWIDWGADDVPPIATEASASYNTKEKCFYKKEFGLDSKWERTDFEEIYDDNPNLIGKSKYMQEKYQSFLYKYMSILHKEQLCHFSAYAIDLENKNRRSIKNKQVERHSGDYFWIYDPDTFHGEKWDTESIDGLVKEVLPSRECLEGLLERHDAADAELKRKEQEERRERRKSIPKRVENFIGKYPRLLWLIISLGTFLVGIVSLIVSYSKG